MIILGGIIAYLAVYFGIGWWLAERDLPRTWEVARKKWITAAYALDDVKESTTLTLLFWPVVLPARAYKRMLTQTVIEHDPREQERRVREQAAYIKKLERKLGINQENK